jgi:hypothetical protein
MDTIATWLHTKAKWKVNMVKPAKIVYTRNFKLKTLNAGKRENKKTKQPVDSAEMEIGSDTTSN